MWYAFRGDGERKNQPDDAEKFCSATLVNPGLFFFRGCKFFPGCKPPLPSPAQAKVKNGARNGDQPDQCDHRDHAHSQHESAARALRELEPKLLGSAADRDPGAVNPDGQLRARQIQVRQNLVGARQGVDQLVRKVDWVGVEDADPLDAVNLVQLAQKFNLFYHNYHILSETDASRRAVLVAIAQVARRQMVKALDILGIEAPERM